ncbi:Chemotaxis protein methyltransferase CheR [hydrothermal vent metagenome]|uniref:Chemotaxis protein methyltransferase CheR n=1 Tax=hydrothermal vent metagenome TaxID=652676 RepID=A0A3B1A7S3_9ZZZZ
MVLSIIENLLYNAMGLNAASIGSSAIQYAVEQRMSDCNIIDINTYTKVLHTDKNELQELIEEVVVAETWFFRDKLPFKMLTQFVQQEWLQNNLGKQIRILSLPCATGEEPYSIAITLIEAGLMPSQLKIDAFDISERNINRCKSAHYRENSFRGVDKHIRDRFFDYDEQFYYPDILIQAMVNFETASVLDEKFVNTQIPYDIVFCRNLLIYFDRDTQAQAVKMLSKLLNDEGLLFVGHAETSIFSKNWFVSQRYKKSFIIRKTDDALITSKKTEKKIIRKKLPKAPKKIFRERRKTVRANAPKPRTEKPALTASLKKDAVAIDSPLIKAMQFADSGKLIEAETICMSYIEKNKTDKEVYFLLAIIQLALGNELKSLHYFKNVIYLDPEHYDALMYLATMLGEEGDEIGAKRFRERAGRIKIRTEQKRR